MTKQAAHRYLSMEADAPPGFEHLLEPSRRILRSGPIALWSRDPAGVERRLGPLLSKLRGVLLCPGEPRRKTQLGPELWRLEVSEASVPVLAELANAWLEQSAQVHVLRDALGHRELELARERHDRSILVEKLDRETQSLRDHLAARTMWTTEAMASLVNFGAQGVEDVETDALPATAVSFLISKPLTFSGAAMYRTCAEGWECLAMAGEADKLGPPGADAPVDDTVFRQNFHHSRATDRQPTEYAVVVERRSGLDDAGAAFLVLFTDLLAAHYRARALNADLAQASAQKDALIAELSTPIIQVWPDMVCLPIIGSVDDERAMQITAELLDAVASRQIREVIIDFTGLSTMDTNTVHHFTSLARALGLIGAHCILTGITPAVALTLASLGVELSDVETLSSVQAALATRLGAR